MGLFKKKVSKNTGLPIENISIQRSIPKCIEWKIDTLFISTNRLCKTCGIYNAKVYSLYGWNKQYPPLPTILYKRRCPECNDVIGASIYFPGSHTF